MSERDQVGEEAEAWDEARDLGLVQANKRVVVCVAAEASAQGVMVELGAWEQEVAVEAGVSEALA